MSSPPVKELMDRWPALHMQSEVYAEFQRITNQNLPNTFYAELDRHTPRLMALFRQKASKTGKTADTLADIFKVHDTQELHDVHTRRTTVLHALPVYLREEVSGFFRTCVDDMDEPDLGDASVVLLTTVSDDATSPVHYHPVRVSVVLEGDVVVNLPTLADAFLVMFGLIYALHLSYPKGLTNMFEFTQKILLGLDDFKLSPKLQTLKNDLMFRFACGQHVGGGEAITYSRELLLALRPLAVSDNILHIPRSLRISSLQAAASGILSKKHRRKRGRRGGVQRRLRKYGLRDRRRLPALPTILLSNVQSIRNKMDELEAHSRCKRDFRETCLLAFTETWLGDADPNEDLHITGFGYPCPYGPVPL
ncbi:hypothetical protein N1851_002615 [Merluccius polli]|uniref:Uncharacterized protein n=1 Tax=Merluccius polli TaxID=89951 RepID=A0AA47P8I7_MERPO|nr:hypothetical protein N1851_002615 [Merluccius polli]